jgi:hypothetical protein
VRSEKKARESGGERKGKKGAMNQAYTAAIDNTTPH